MARFKEMCLDTTREDGAIAEFWAAVTGMRAESFTSTPVKDVVGQEEHQNIAICVVPEPKTVKNRVHLDLDARSVADVVALGATVDLPAEESGFGWTTMRDPEDNELCVFVRDQPDPWRVHGIGVDCVDAAATATWWAQALGLEVTDNAEHGGGWWTVLGLVPGVRLTFDFQGVPEPKTVKNRMHWDLYGTPEEFLDRGATFLWEVPGRERPVAWTTLADPEGNEFCVFEEPTA